MIVVNLLFPHTEMLKARCHTDFFIFVFLVQVHSKCFESGKSIPPPKEYLPAMVPYGRDVVPVTAETGMETTKPPKRFAGHRSCRILEAQVAQKSGWNVRFG